MDPSQSFTSNDKASRLIDSSANVAPQLVIIGYCQWPRLHGSKLSSGSKDMVNYS